MHQFKQSSSPIKKQYIDLDAIAMLQDNMKTMEENGQPIYYLGWSGTDIDGELIWDNTIPVDFNEEEQRILFIHIDANMQRQFKDADRALQFEQQKSLFDRQAATKLKSQDEQTIPDQVLVVRAHRQCRVGDIVSFSNQLMNQIIGNKNLNNPKKIVAFRLFEPQKRDMFCLQYFLTQSNLILARLSLKTEIHIAPIFQQRS